MNKKGWGGHFQLSTYYMLCDWSGQIAIGISLGYNIVVCDNCYKPLLEKEYYEEIDNIIDLDILSDSMWSE